MACSVGPQVGPDVARRRRRRRAINPFNGEGIAYAYETGRMAADVLDEALAHRRRPGPAGLRAAARRRVRASTTRWPAPSSSIIGRPAADAASSRRHGHAQPHAHGVGAAHHGQPAAPRRAGPGRGRLPRPPPPWPGSPPSRSAGSGPSLILAAWTSCETEEQPLLREAVAKIGRRLRPRLLRRRSHARAEADRAVGRRRPSTASSASTCPRSTAAAAQGIVELAIVAEELAAAGCPLLLHGGLAGDLRHGHRPVRHRRAEASAGCPAWPAARRRWPSPSPSPTPGRTPTSSSTVATRDGDEYRLSGHEVLHLRGRRGRRHPGRGPHRRRRPTGRAAGSRCSSCRPTRPGFEQTLIPVEIVAPGEAVHAVLRRRAGAGRRRSSATEGDGLRQVFAGLNPERITGRGARQRHRPLRARQGRRPTPTSAQVWGVPIGAHQGIAHPLAQGEDRGRAGPADDARRRPGSTTTATTPARRRTWPSTPRPRPALRRARPGDPDPRRQRPGHRVRPGRPVGRRPPAPHRPGQPRDDPQLRGQPQPGLPRSY